MPWTRAVVENNLTMNSGGDRSYPISLHLTIYLHYSNSLSIKVLAFIQQALFKVHFKTSSWVGKFSRFAGLLLLRPSPAKLGNSTPVL